MPTTTRQAAGSSPAAIDLASRAARVGVGLQADPAGGVGPDQNAGRTAVAGADLQHLAAEVGLHPVADVRLPGRGLGEQVELRPDVRIAVLRGGHGQTRGSGRRPAREASAPRRRSSHSRATGRKAVPCRPLRMTKLKVAASSTDWSRSTSSSPAVYVAQPGTARFVASRMTTATRQADQGEPRHGRCHDQQPDADDLAVDRDGAEAVGHQARRSSSPTCRGAAWPGGWGSCTRVAANGRPPRRSGSRARRPPRGSPAAAGGRR